MTEIPPERMTAEGGKVEEIRFYRAVGEFGFLSNLYKMEIGFYLPEECLKDQDATFRPSRFFNNTEAAYQYGKPLKLDVAEWIVSAPKPHLVAMAAHGLFVFDVDPTWNQRKVDRMRWVLSFKFNRHKQWMLCERLLATGEANLIEESKTDAFWGTGKSGKGKNMLGVLLMELRSSLRKEIEDQRKKMQPPCLTQAKEP